MSDIEEVAQSLMESSTSIVEANTQKESSECQAVIKKNGKISEVSYGQDKEQPRGFWKPRLKTFLENVGVSGLGYVLDEDCLWARRIWWLILIIGSIAIVVLQIATQIINYFDYPVNVVIEEHFKQSLNFPSVTICPESRISKKKVQAYGKGLETLFNEDYHPYLGREEGLTRARGINLTHVSTDWHSTYTEISKAPNDSLLHCYMQGYGYCKKDWATSHLTFRGNCLTFNADGSKKQLVEGGNAGFITLVYVNQSDDVGLNSFASGLQVSLHGPNDYPSIWTGFKAPPGFLTSVSLQMQQTDLLEPPYGKCAERELEYFVQYSRSNCLYECLSKKIQERCGCILLGYPGPKEEVCNPMQELSCAHRVDLTFDNHTAHTCDCPVSCHMEFYTPSLSVAPTANSMVEFLRKRVNLTAEDFRENVAGLLIYYPTLGYKAVTSQKAYTVTSLFCDIGGAFGLLLGSTLLTIYEFFDFFIWNGVSRCKKNNKSVNLSGGHAMNENRL